MSAPRRGPIEAIPWPEVLEGHAVAEGPDPRLHGYALESDLALHYRAADLLLLALTGELPDERCSRAFDVALAFLMGVGVAQPDVHATVLAALAGARPSGVLAVATAGAAEEAAQVLARVGERDGAAAEALRARDDDERASVARLRAALRTLGWPDVLPREEEDPSRELAVTTLLGACGLRTPLAFATAFAVARAAVGAAEAGPRRPLGFDRYPTTTAPSFDLVGGPR